VSDMMGSDGLCGVLVFYGEFLWAENC